MGLLEPLPPITWKQKKILAGILLPQLLSWCPLRLYSTILNNEVRNLWKEPMIKVNDSGEWWNSGLYIFSSLSALILSTGTSVLIDKIGPKKTLMLGVLASGFGSILTAFLQLAVATNLYAFISVAYFGRLLTGFGWITIYAVNLTYIVDIFPKHISLFVGAAEILTGLSSLIAIPLGKLIMQEDDFFVPFLGFGVFTMFTLPLIICLFPEQQNLDERRKLANQKSFKTNSEEYLDFGYHYNSPKFFKLCKLPNTFFMVMVMVILGVAWSFVLTTVEGQLAHTHAMETKYASSILGITAITYSLLAPFWGYVASSVQNHKKWIIVVLGLILGGFMFIVTGILVFLEVINAAQYITCLVLMTIFLSAAYVPAFESCIIHTIHDGYESTMRTFGTVSIWIAMGYALGCCIGAAGGFVADTRIFGYGLPIGIYGIIIIIWGALVFYQFGGRVSFNPGSSFERARQSSMKRRDEDYNRFFLSIHVNKDID